MSGYPEIGLCSEKLVSTGTYHCLKQMEVPQPTGVDDGGGLAVVFHGQALLYWETIHWPWSRLKVCTKKLSAMWAP